MSAPEARAEQQPSKEAAAAGQPIWATEPQSMHHGSLLEIFIQARMCYEHLRTDGPRTKRQLVSDPMALALRRIMDLAEQGLGTKLHRPDRG